MELPKEYVNYLERLGVLETVTEGEPGYIALWPLADIEQNNRDLEVAKYAPGFLGFGGDGGGEFLAFEKNGIVYMLPMIGMEPDQAIRIADSWTELEQRILQSSNVESSDLNDD